MTELQVDLGNYRLNISVHWSVLQSIDLAQYVDATTGSSRGLQAGQVESPKGRPRRIDPFLSAPNIAHFLLGPERGI
jgi:hypothetical protein